MTALTRGPLSARVYWRRRLVVVLVLVGLVIGTARVLTLGSDGEDDTPQATQAAAETGDSPAAEPSATATGEPAPGRSRARHRQNGDAEQARGDRSPGRRKRDREPVLAEPDGVCSDRDIAVTPTVRRPAGGSAVTFTLELRTVTTPACTWRVSPTTLTMRITSGNDDIWSSQDCPRAIPQRDLVVRNDATTEVEVTWSGRRSDDDCSTLTEWALPGWYYVDVAALAGEPSDLHFELEKPEPGVVLETVKPEPEPKRRDRGGRAARGDGTGGRTRG